MLSCVARLRPRPFPLACITTFAQVKLIKHCARQHPTPSSLCNPWQPVLTFLRAHCNSEQCCPGHASADGLPHGHDIEGTAINCKRPFSDLCMQAAPATGLQQLAASEEQAGHDCISRVEVVPWLAWQRPQQQPVPLPQPPGSQLAVPALLLA